MKKALLLLLIVIGVAFVVERRLQGDFSGITSKTGVPVLVKDHRLYSWNKQGEWYFSLLAKGQRAKSIEEIKSSSIAVKGISALKDKFDSLPRHQRIVWSAEGKESSLPPESVINQIKRYCDNSGLALQIDRSRSQ